LKINRVTGNIPIMSLSEIEKAVDELSPDELAKLAAHIARRDKLVWDEEIERDFSPGGKHEETLKQIDAEIDSGNFTPLP
jgi:SOS-response transcriptional repressor LexA